MEANQNAERLAREAGFTHLAHLDCNTIRLLPEVRQMCEVNSCGKYGKNWACPPGCGSLEECRERISAYHWGILVQTVGELEDSLDVESMKEIEERHKKAFRAGIARMQEAYPGLLCLGAGCCTVCESCTCPDEPCRFPERRISSLESYGINVSELCSANDLPYYYGPNTLAYTSCYLLG